MHPRSTTTRLRRWALGVALLTAAGVTTGCEADTIEAIMNAHANSAGPGQINSADNGASIPIGDDKYLLLYNDAFIGPLEPDLERPPGTKLVNNAIVSWTSRTNTLHNTYLGAGTTALYKPSNPNHFYWLTNGVKDGSMIRLLAQERVRPTEEGGSFPIVANVVLSVPVANLHSTPTVTPIALPSGNPQIIWGEGIITWNGHWYLYGALADGLAHKTLLARVPVGSLHTASAWRYYVPGTGTWSASPDDAGSLRLASGGHVPYLLNPRVHDGKVVSLATTGVFDDRFRWASSATPWGAVTMGADAHHPPEAGQPCGVGAGRIVYSVHPHASEPEESLWSYSTTCWAPKGTTGSRYAPDYRPRFFNVDLDDAPAPCPALGVAETERFVKAAYLDLPGWSPSAGDLAYWTNEIATKGYCRSRLTNALAVDAGYLGGIVDDAYQLTLDRLPGPGPRAARLARLQAGTDTSTDLYVALLASGEFRDLAGGTDAGYVTRLYQKLLGFTPSSGDLAYWTGRVTAVGAERVAKEIYQSADSATRRVQALANRYLGRSLSGTELTTWRTRLTTGTNNDVTVSRDLVNSTEYFNRAQTRFP